MTYQLILIFGFRNESGMTVNNNKQYSEKRNNINKFQCPIDACCGGEGLSLFELELFNCTCGNIKPRCDVFLVKSRHFGLPLVQTTMAKFAISLSGWLGSYTNVEYLQSLYLKRRGHLKTDSFTTFDFWIIFLSYSELNLKRT